VKTSSLPSKPVRELVTREADRQQQPLSSLGKDNFLVPPEISVGFALLELEAYYAPSSFLSPQAPLLKFVDLSRTSYALRDC
jgi:hypothetical protein